VIAGTEPDRWYGYRLPSTAGCYGLPTRGRDEGATVATEEGLRLKKAADFVAPRDTDGIYDTPNYRFCLNDRGEVASYDY
jgi:hypothetical protein